MIFDKKYFSNLNFSQKQIKNYLNSAYKDYNIAKNSNIIEVKFQFSYNSLIKLGIGLISCYNKKVSSKAGHHMKIIEAVSEILDDQDIYAIANQMRKTRNTEMYDGGEIFISEKQINEYLKFVESLFKKSKNIFKEKLNTLF